MSEIRAFCGLRPAKDLADKVASLPYDVMNREEAKAMAAGNPYSFLHIVRAEIDLPDSLDAYDEKVYEQSRETLLRFEREATLKQDEKPKLYIYRQMMDGRVQTGLVAAVSVDEYLNGDIKKHELTRAAKERDRIRHFDACDANTAPIFLSYRHRAEIDRLIRDYIKFHKPENEFRSEDGILHITWVIHDEETIEAIIREFDDVPALYIADGHHRSASAAKVGLMRRESFPEAAPDAEFNYFMAVIFPDEDLFIMDYNRVVKDLNGLETADFLNKLQEAFVLNECEEAYRPMQKGHYGMFLDGKWYELAARPELYEGADIVGRLDVQILQKHLLDPLLGIKDPRTDERIDFVGGIRGLSELERRAGSDMRLAFSLCPTSMEELLSIADQGEIMPPKSTWFEPKLRSGLFIHKLS